MARIMKYRVAMLVLLSLVGNMSCTRLDLSETSKGKNPTLQKSAELLKMGSPGEVMNRLKSEPVHSRRQILEILSGVYWLSVDDEDMGAVRRKIRGILVLPFSPTCVKEARRIVLHSPNEVDVKFLIDGDIFGRTTRDLPYYQALIETHPKRATKAKRMMGIVQMHPLTIYSGAFNRLEEGTYSEASNFIERYAAFEEALDKVILSQYGFFAQQENYRTMMKMYLEEIGLGMKDIVPPPYAANELKDSKAEDLYRMLKKKIKSEKK